MTEKGEDDVKKRTLVWAVVLILALVAGSLSAAAEGEGASGKVRAYGELFGDLNQSPNMKSVNLSISNAEIGKIKANYQKGVAVSTEKKLESLRKYIGDDALPSPDMSLQLNLVKDYYPELAEYSYQTAVKSYTLTRNNLMIALRQLYLGYFSADRTLASKEKTLAIAQKKLEFQQKQYDLGVISRFELKEQKYAVKEAEVNRDTAKTDLEDIKRQLNAFLGVDLNTTYEIKPETELEPLKERDTYVAEALKNRFEITNNIALSGLKDIELRTYSANNRLVYKNINRSYEVLKRERKIQDIERSVLEDQIRTEIIMAYDDVVKARDQIAHFDRLIEIQKTKLSHLKAQNRLGLLDNITMMEVEEAILELETQRDILIYNSNTEQKKLTYAAGIGPAYQ